MKYVQVEDGEWIEPNPQTGHKMACCDCGLVHIMNFRVEDGKVQFQAYRDNRATGAKRRKLKANILDTIASIVLWVSVGAIGMFLIYLSESSR